jgi:hypothetical protein
LHCFKVMSKHGKEKRPQVSQRDQKKEIVKE